MDAWRKEREKIRNSRFFEDVEIKPYERKTFQEVEIRPGWETKTVKEPTPEPEPVPEPVPPPKPVEPEPQTGPKYDSKNLYRANSIHIRRSIESVSESRKSSLPHIMNFSIRPETFKKKSKKGFYFHLHLSSEGECVRVVSTVVSKVIFARFRIVKHIPTI